VRSSENTSGYTSNISSDDGKARLEELAFKVICVFMQERKFNI
jgi:hypothetical protein